MTEGSFVKKILLFALPVFLGQFLQQLYNVVDSIVVGQFAGKEALAAVSSSGNLIFLMVGFINGLFAGAGVIISKRYGAGDREGVKTAVHTAVAFGLIMGVFVTVFAIVTVPYILRLMGTPADVLPKSIMYFRIFFLGGMGNVMYNTCCGIFNAVGDSKRPLYYLIVSAVTNTILDLIFTAGLNMGVAGAAAASAIAQLLSAALAFIRLTKETGVHRVELSKIKIEKKTLIQELRLGIPTGIQNSVIAIANVTVQANINAFGSAAMAGSGSYFKLEGFAFLPINSFCMAITTFIGQNLGAKKFDRAKQGARFGIIMGILGAEAIGAILWLTAPVLLRMFSNDPQVLAYGITQAHIEAFFYCLLALSHCTAAVLRGAGKSTIPMAIMLVCWCLIRITYITITIRIIPDIRVIYCAYPITWSLSSVLFIIFYLKSDWLHYFEKKKQLA